MAAESSRWPMRPATTPRSFSPKTAVPGWSIWFPTTGLTMASGHSFSPTLWASEHSNNHSGASDDWIKMVILLEPFAWMWQLRHFHGWIPCWLEWDSGVRDYSIEIRSQVWPLPNSCKTKLGIWIPCLATRCSAGSVFRLPFKGDHHPNKSRELRLMINHQTFWVIFSDKRIFK